MPGAVALTKTLPRDKWIVVTSGTRRLVEARFAATDIDPPAIITADDVALGKPDPAPYLAAAARLQVDPRDCVVFEDTGPGVAAGRAAGATVIGVVGAAGGSHGAHYHVADLTHIEVDVTENALEITIVGRLPTEPSVLGSKGVTR
jgi:sugar-phosphatase